jgi:hypothetical protein
VHALYLIIKREHEHASLWSCLKTERKYQITFGYLVIYATSVILWLAVRMLMTWAPLLLGASENGVLEPSTLLRQISFGMIDEYHTSLLFLVNFLFANRLKLHSEDFRDRKPVSQGTKASFNSFALNSGSANSAPIIAPKNTKPLVDTSMRMVHVC